MEFVTETIVKYHNHMGTDKTIVDAARISLDGDDHLAKLLTKDVKLINYLAKHKHMSPFEHNTLTVVVHCPLFTRSHIQRHRTFSYNEVSRRYTSENLAFWIPPEWLMQADSNRQSSSEPLINTEGHHADIVYKNSIVVAVKAYEQLIDMGVSREQARAVLPQSLMTRFYMTGNLRNWAHFLALRSNPDTAQAQDVEVSAQVSEILMDLWPVATLALIDHP